MANGTKNAPDYYRERNVNNLEKIDALLQELPSFCEDFLRGVETRTSSLTRLNYVYDLRIFFDFLSKKKFRGKDVHEITLEELETVTDTDLEIFLSYLSNYRFGEKRLSCNERANARKLSSELILYSFCSSVSDAAENSGKAFISADISAAQAVPGSRPSIRTSAKSVLRHLRVRCFIVVFFSFLMSGSPPPVFAPVKISRGREGFSLPRPTFPRSILGMLTHAHLFTS